MINEVCLQFISVNTERFEQKINMWRHKQQKQFLCFSIQQCVKSDCYILFPISLSPLSNPPCEFLILTLYHKISLVFSNPQEEVKKIVGRRESAGNQHFLFSYHVFYLFRTFYHTIPTLNDLEKEASLLEKEKMLVTSVFYHSQNKF